MAGRAEQAAQSQAVFREANEEIARARERLGATGRTPFVCECEDSSCTQVVRTTAAEFEEVRSSPRRFLVAPGHDAHDRVVAERDGYSVVEKDGPGDDVVAARAMN